jgi:hypothetical protein
MQVDALALDLRPRSMMEATDLGVRLVQLRARSVWRTVGPLYLVLVALALSTVEIAGWLPALLIFWLKPWLDRSLLFVLSRAVFGEDTRFADLWQAQRKVWWGSLLHTLTMRRLSPWRSFTQAMHQLEGQRGAARRKRRTQFLRGKKGAATAMHLAFAHLELVFILGVLALAVWFDPDGNTGRNIFDALRTDDSVATSLLSATVYAGIVLLLEPFYVAAGFAMYLNRRVELEAWDIEQEFRRAFAA